MNDVISHANDGRQPWLRSQRQPRLALLLYAGLCVIMTWPLAGRLGTHIPASEGDAWIHYWTFNWIKQSLLSGQELLYTRSLFYPSGVSLLYHNIAWVNIALWLPLQALVGAGAAYSLVFMTVLALNGFATYLLARAVVRSEAAAFIGGLICAFWPYTLSHHDHPSINGHIFPIPMPYDWIDDLFLVRTIRHPSRLNVPLSIPVALLVVLGITSLQRYTWSKRHSWVLMGVIGFLILSEYMVAYPTFPLARIIMSA